MTRADGVRINADKIARDGRADFPFRVELRFDRQRGMRMNPGNQEIIGVQGIKNGEPRVDDALDRDGNSSGIFNNDKKRVFPVLDGVDKVSGNGDRTRDKKGPCQFLARDG